MELQLLFCVQIFVQNNLHYVAYEYGTNNANNARIIQCMIYNKQKNTQTNQKGIIVKN